jgi:pilus assembly protein Flp/PilA
LRPTTPYHAAGPQGSGAQESGWPLVVRPDPTVKSEKKEVKKQMLSLYFKLRGLLSRQEGQGMVEYALILVLVSIVVIVILLTMGTQIKNVFNNVVGALGT